MVTGKAVPLPNVTWKHLGEQRNSSVHELTTRYKQCSAECLQFSTPQKQPQIPGWRCWKVFILSRCCWRTSGWVKCLLRELRHCSKSWRRTAHCDCRWYTISINLRKWYKQFSQCWLQFNSTHSIRYYNWKTQNQFILPGTSYFSAFASNRFKKCGDAINAGIMWHNLVHRTTINTSKRFPSILMWSIT